MAPWAVLLCSLEKAVYTGIDRLSALSPAADDFGPVDDPLAPAETAESAA